MTTMLPLERRRALSHAIDAYAKVAAEDPGEVNANVCPAHGAAVRAAAEVAPRTTPLSEVYAVADEAATGWEWDDERGWYRTITDTETRS